jgi:hypothetical protein
MASSKHDVFDLVVKRYDETERYRALCTLIAHKLVRAANAAEENNSSDTTITIYDFDGPESSEVMIVWGTVSDRVLNLDFKIRFDFTPTVTAQVTANIDVWIEHRGCEYNLGSMNDIIGLDPIGELLFARLDAGIKMMGHII